MRTLRAYETNARLRKGRVWSLLAADKAPTMLALLETLFLQDERELAASVFESRLTRELEYLEGTDGQMGRSAAQLMADWLSKGWIVRYLPKGSREEVFSLTSDAQQAIQFVQRLERPHLATTESRLATVMQQVERLARETDSNLQSRISALQAEREAIDRQIVSMMEHGVEVLPADRALERIREILVLAQGLTADFKQVREAFEQLNRDVRRQFLDPDSTRAEQLQAAFDGKDVIDQSEAGRTFSAFLRLLTSGEQSEGLNEALAAITSREFARHLDVRDRQFLRNLRSNLLTESRQVKSVVQHFATGLRSFVKSREFREHRRMAGLLREAQHEALAVVEAGKEPRQLNFPLRLSSANIDSISRWRLNDPSEAIVPAPMEKAEPATLTADDLRTLYEGDDIDFRTLRANIRAALAESDRVSVRALLERFGTPQGLGTVVGYMALALEHGATSGGRDCVSWDGPTGARYRGFIPEQYFQKESLRTLAA